MQLNRHIDVTPRISLPTVAITVMVCLTLNNDGHADEIRVPQDHKTIHDAIRAAKRGATILVSAGTWKERIKLIPGLTLRSVGDDTKGEIGLKRAETTIIDGGGIDGNGASVTMAEGATIDGFTVTNVGPYDEAEWNKHHATQARTSHTNILALPGLLALPSPA